MKAVSFTFESTIEAKKATEEKKYQISNCEIDLQRMPVACSLLKSTEKSIDGEIQSILGLISQHSNMMIDLGLTLK